MKLKMIFYLRCVALFLVCCFCVGLMVQDDVSAYFGQGEGSNGKYECFALQYKYVIDAGFNRVDAKEGDGTSTNSYGAAGSTYGTEKICAYVDNNGKVKNGKLYNRGQLGNTEPMKHPRLGGGTNTVKVYYCGSGGNICGAKELESPAFSVSDYGTFKELAEAVHRFAQENVPIAQGDAKLEPLGSEANIETAREEAQEKAQKKTEQDFGGNSSGSNSSVCYDKSGKLGWIFCPLIEGISGAMEDLYGSVVEPFLVIEPELLTGSGTYTAWDVFRNFANIAFVILFLAVIFSQLTGYGIDNYGVKRMLPKLIIAAIMINLSYVICQLAVDVSNILGNSLESLFVDIAKQVNAEAGSPSSYFTGLLGGMMAFVGLGATTVYAGITIMPLAIAGFASIIPILLTLISAIISVLFMFVILFVRKALVILLVTVAPVAFVAYIMPNTKRAIYDKWLNMFKGALAVYPLAGALVGGGVLASSIIVSAATSQAASEGKADIGTFLLFAGALLLQVVPFFFLPRLFRSSLSAAGNLGERITNRGRQFNQRARGTVENSDRVKEFQKDWSDRAAAGRARRVRDSLANRKNLSERQRMAYARASNRVAGYEKGREDMYSSILARETDRDKIENTLNSALAGTDAEQASAALNEIVARGGITEAMNALNKADWSKMDNRVKQRITQTMAASNVDALQSYAKYRNSGGSAGFSNWYNGTKTDAERDADAEANNGNGVKDATYAHHLQERDIHAMDNLSKDEMQFMTDESRSDAFKASMSAAGANYGAMMASAAVNSGDARVKTEAESAIASGLASGEMSLSDMNLTSDSLANMRDETADAIRGAYEAKWAASHPTWTADQQKAAARREIQVQLEKQINAAKANPNAMSKMSGKMRDLIGP